jgi:excisionase family DNA binding protein
MSENTGSDKRIFTTGEAARICKVSQQTIIRCFDNGRLTGFKVPGSKFRRIPRDELVRFMRENGMPLSELGERPRVLVVDDDPTLLSAARSGLERDGLYEVASASNGFDAGLLAATFRPDVLVLEYMLADVDGAAVCRRLRAEHASSDIKILCVSANADGRIVEELRRAGADGFMHKPFSPGALADRIASMLRDR